MSVWSRRGRARVPNGLKTPCPRVVHFRLGRPAPSPTSALRSCNTALRGSEALETNWWGSRLPAGNRPCHETPPSTTCLYAKYEELAREYVSIPEARPFASYFGAKDPPLEFLGARLSIAQAAKQTHTDNVVARVSPCRLVAAPSYQTIVL